MCINSGLNLPVYNHAFCPQVIRLLLNGYLLDIPELYMAVTTM